MTTVQSIALVTESLLPYMDEGNGAEMIPTAMADLLADMRHMATVLGLDWADITEQAERHFLSEQQA